MEWFRSIAEPSLRRVLLYVVRKTLEPFISQPLHPRQVEVALASGQVTLRDLQLNPATLNRALRGLAIRVTDASVREIRAEVPLSMLMSRRVSVTLDGLRVRARPIGADDNWQEHWSTAAQSPQHEQEKNERDDRERPDAGRGTPEQPLRGDAPAEATGELLEVLADWVHQASNEAEILFRDIRLDLDGIKEMSLGVQGASGGKPTSRRRQSRVPDGEAVPVVSFAMPFLRLRSNEEIEHTESASEPGAQPKTSHLRESVARMMERTLEFPGFRLAFFCRGTDNTPLQCQSLISCGPLGSATEPTRRSPRTSRVRVRARLDAAHPSPLQLSISLLPIHIHLQPHRVAEAASVFAVAFQPLPSVQRHAAAPAEPPSRRRGGGGATASSSSASSLLSLHDPSFQSSAEPRRGQAITEVDLERLDQLLRGWASGRMPPAQGRGAGATVPGGGMWTAIAMAMQRHETQPDPAGRQEEADAGGGAETSVLDRLLQGLEPVASDLDAEAAANRSSREGHRKARAPHSRQPSRHVSFAATPPGAPHHVHRAHEREAHACSSAQHSSPGPHRSFQPAQVDALEKSMVQNIVAWDAWRTESSLVDTCIPATLGKSSSSDRLSSGSGWQSFQSAQGGDEEWAWENARGAPVGDRFHRAAASLQASHSQLASSARFGGAPFIAATTMPCMTDSFFSARGERRLWASRESPAVGAGASTGERGGRGGGAALGAPSMLGASVATLKQRRAHEVLQLELSLHCPQVIVDIQGDDVAQGSTTEPAGTDEGNDALYPASHPPSALATGVTPEETLRLDCGVVDLALRHSAQQWMLETDVRRVGMRRQHAGEEMECLHILADRQRGFPAVRLTLRFASQETPPTAASRTNHECADQGDTSTAATADSIPRGLVALQTGRWDIQLPPLAMMQAPQRAWHRAMAHILVAGEERLSFLLSQMRLVAGMLMERAAEQLEEQLGEQGGEGGADMVGSMSLYDMTHSMREMGKSWQRSSSTRPRGTKEQSTGSGRPGPEEVSQWDVLPPPPLPGIATSVDCPELRLRLQDGVGSRSCTIASMEAHGIRVWNMFLTGRCIAQRRKRKRRHPVASLDAPPMWLIDFDRVQAWIHPVSTDASSSTSRLLFEFRAIDMRLRNSSRGPNGSLDTTAQLRPRVVVQSQPWEWTWSAMTAVQLAHSSPVDAPPEAVVASGRQGHARQLRSNWVIPRNGQAHEAAGYDMFGMATALLQQTDGPELHRVTATDDETDSSDSESEPMPSGDTHADAGGGADQRGESAPTLTIPPMEEVPDVARRLLCLRRSSTGVRVDLGSVMCHVRRGDWEYIQQWWLLDRPRAGGRGEAGEEEEGDHRAPGERDNRSSTDTNEGPEDETDRRGSSVMTLVTADEARLTWRPVASDPGSEDATMARASSVLLLTGLRLLLEQWAPPKATASELPPAPRRRSQPATFLWLDLFSLAVASRASDDATPLVWLHRAPLGTPGSRARPEQETQDTPERPKRGTGLHADSHSIITARFAFGQDQTAMYIRCQRVWFRIPHADAAACIRASFLGTPSGATTPSSSDSTTDRSASLSSKEQREPTYFRLRVALEDSALLLDPSTELSSSASSSSSRIYAKRGSSACIAWDDCAVSLRQRSLLEGTTAAQSRVTGRWRGVAAWVSLATLPVEWPMVLQLQSHAHAVLTEGCGGPQHRRRAESGANVSFSSSSAIRMVGLPAALVGWTHDVPVRLVAPASASRSRAPSVEGVLCAQASEDDAGGASADRSMRCVLDGWEVREANLAQGWGHRFVGIATLSRARARMWFAKRVASVRAQVDAQAPSGRPTRSPAQEEEEEEEEEDVGVVSTWELSLPAALDTHIRVGEVRFSTCMDSLAAIEAVLRRHVASHAAAEEEPSTKEDAHPPASLAAGRNAGGDDSSQPGRVLAARQSIASAHGTLVAWRPLRDDESSQGVRAEVARLGPIPPEVQRRGWRTQPGGILNGLDTGFFRDHQPRPRGLSSPPSPAATVRSDSVLERRRGAGRAAVGRRRQTMASHAPSPLRDDTSHRRHSFTATPSSLGPGRGTSASASASGGRRPWGPSPTASSGSDTRRPPRIRLPHGFLGGGKLHVVDDYVGRPRGEAGSRLGSSPGPAPAPATAARGDSGSSDPDADAAMRSSFVWSRDHNVSGKSSSAESPSVSHSSSARDSLSDQRPRRDQESEVDVSLVLDADGAVSDSWTEWDPSETPRGTPFLDQFSHHIRPAGEADDESSRFGTGNEEDDEGLGEDMDRIREFVDPWALAEESGALAEESVPSAFHKGGSQGEGEAKLFSPSGSTAQGRGPPSTDQRPGGAAGQRVLPARVQENYVPVGSRGESAVQGDVAWGPVTGGVNNPLDQLSPLLLVPSDRPARLNESIPALADIADHARSVHQRPTVQLERRVLVECEAVRVNVFGGRDWPRPRRTADDPATNAIRDGTDADADTIRASGVQWPSTMKRLGDACVHVEATDIGVRADQYSGHSQGHWNRGETSASSSSSPLSSSVQWHHGVEWVFAVGDIRVDDAVAASPLRRLVGHWASEQHPRETAAPLARIRGATWTAASASELGDPGRPLAWARVDILPLRVAAGRAALAFAVSCARTWQRSRAGMGLGPPAGAGQGTSRRRPEAGTAASRGANGTGSGFMTPRWIGVRVGKLRLLVDYAPHVRSSSSLATASAPAEDDEASDPVAVAADTVLEDLWPWNTVLRYLAVERMDLQLAAFQWPRPPDATSKKSHTMEGDLVAGEGDWALTEADEDPGSYGMDGDDGIGMTLDLVVAALLQHWTNDLTHHQMHACLAGAAGPLLPLRSLTRAGQGVASLLLLPQRWAQGRGRRHAERPTTTAARSTGDVVRTAQVVVRAGSGFVRAIAVESLRVASGLTSAAHQVIPRSTGDGGDEGGREGEGEAGGPRGRVGAGVRAAAGMMQAGWRSAAATIVALPVSAREAYRAAGTAAAARTVVNAVPLAVLDPMRSTTAAARAVIDALQVAIQSEEERADAEETFKP